MKYMGWFSSLTYLGVDTSSPTEVEVCFNKENIDEKG